MNVHIVINKFLKGNYLIFFTSILLFARNKYLALTWNLIVYQYTVKEGWVLRLPSTMQSMHMQYKPPKRVAHFQDTSIPKVTRVQLLLKLSPLC